MTQLESVGSVLTDGERAALHARLAPGQGAFGSTATLRDIAEATGLSEADVATHLKRIRTEFAFSAPQETRPSALPWIAAGALLVGVGVTAWRLRPEDPLAPYRRTGPIRPIVTPVATPSASIQVNTRPVATTSVPVFMESEGPAAAPSGFRVEIVGQHRSQLGQGPGDVKVLPYLAVRDGLALSAETLVKKLEIAEAGMGPAPKGARYQSMEGGSFTPRPGFVRVTMSGWAGRESAWIAVPLTDAGRRQIHTLAESMLSDVKNEQDGALAPVADPKAGVVGPPPGYSVRFAGRRLDLQMGPRVSFAGMTQAMASRRLEAALLNAIYRDRRPPRGAWSKNAAQEAKIPPPDLSRVEILGPGGIVSADLPTDPDDPGATASAVRALVERTTRPAVSIQKESIQRSTSGNYAD